MSKAQIMLTFDDGLGQHLDVSHHLLKKNLRGVFGIVTGRTDQVGFLDSSQLALMQEKGHFICNHSEHHLWSGLGESKHQAKASREDLTADCLNAREKLNKEGFHGDYFIAPFGTTNILDSDHLRQLLETLKWIRLTIGAPLPDDLNLWTPYGAKRLYPFGYSESLIGITDAADLRYPDNVRNWTQWAVDTGSLCVLSYHTVWHVVGNTQAITWEHFVNDIEFIGKMVKDGQLECIIPTDLVE